MKKAVSLFLTVCILFSAFCAIPTQAAAATEKYEPEDERYRREFISALLADEKAWKPSYEFGSYLCFADMDFDGKQEFLVSTGGGSSHIVNTKIYSWDGTSTKELKNTSDRNYFSISNNDGTLYEYGYYLNPNALTYYYDKIMNKYVITGLMGLRSGWASGWSGFYSLRFQDSTPEFSYKYSSRMEIETTENKEYITHYTYYGNTPYYAQTEGVKTITESEYNLLTKKAIENYIDVDVNIDTVSLNTWNKSSNSKKKQLLQDSYDGFGYNDIGGVIFLNKHLDYIGNRGEDNAYHNQLKAYDPADIALDNSEDMQFIFNSWRAFRGNIFDNPYYTVLSDMILKESNAQAQAETFDVHFNSEYRALVNDILDIIDSKIDLDPTQKDKIRLMFINKDYSDSTSYNICKEAFGDVVSDKSLKGLFVAHDLIDTFADFADLGINVVEAVNNTINYSAILKAYSETSVEFKKVLTQVAYNCRSENPWLYKAIHKYADSDYNSEMLKKKATETAKVGYKAYDAFFKDALVETVRDFLISNMDLGTYGAKASVSILSFVQGLAIGYAVGTGIDNILFNTDNAANSYATAIAAAKASKYLKAVLEDNEAALRNNPTYENAVLFCESFNMYKNIQLDTANTMIRYCNENQQSLVNRINGNEVIWENAIYEWQLRKLNWMDVSCHKGYNHCPKVKNITVACPVDVVIYDSSGNTVLTITDNTVTASDDNVIASVCNNIKYITLPDDNYRVSVSATDSGTMSYSVTDRDAIKGTAKTVLFSNIKIEKGQDYSSALVSGDEYSNDDVALRLDEEKVDCEISEFTNNSIVPVDSVLTETSPLILDIEEQSHLTAEVKPSNASSKAVTWYSEDPDIAEVDEYGNVTALSAGNTKIVCKPLVGVGQSETAVYVKSDVLLLGDTDRDGSISINDAAFIQRKKADFEIPTFFCADTADADGDEQITVMDATFIQKWLVDAESNDDIGKAIEQ